MSDVKLGDVVMVVGKLDERVRTSEVESRQGTIVTIYKDDVEVLFEDGTIWRGMSREVVKDV